MHFAGLSLVKTRAMSNLTKNYSKTSKKWLVCKKSFVKLMFMVDRTVFVMHNQSKPNINEFTFLMFMLNISITNL